MVGSRVLDPQERVLVQNVGRFAISPYGGRGAGCAQHGGQSLYHNEGVVAWLLGSRLTPSYPHPLEGLGAGSTFSLEGEGDLMRGWQRLARFTIEGEGKCAFQRKIRSP